jgi:hypothetical protein
LVGAARRQGARNGVVDARATAHLAHSKGSELIAMNPPTR